MKERERMRDRMFKRFDWREIALREQLLQICCVIIQGVVPLLLGSLRPMGKTEGASLFAYLCAIP